MGIDAQSSKFKAPSNEKLKSEDKCISTVAKQSSFVMENALRG